MRIFEKIIIPLVVNNITTIDLTGAAGFVDSYTEDPDKPSADSELFLMYEMNTHNEFTESRAIRLSQHPYLKRDYVKYIEGIPYHIYSFYIPNQICKFYKYGSVRLTMKQKFDILSFWGTSNDTFNKILNEGSIPLDIEHKMPLADYEGPVDPSDW